ncbi:MAG: type II secretion system F family protein [Candidatus Pacebacteria bacterium]|nr:type II secretion system F family protein [Candidatus Paceibacterota bacterium]
MLFNYKVITKDGSEKKGQIEAVSSEVAVATLQRRDYVVVSVTQQQQKGILKRIPFFNTVKMKDIVLMTKQASTLFEAQVSAVKTFELLGQNSESPIIQDALSEVAEDIRGGTSISGAMARQPKIFSDFYVNMIRAGEESGNLSKTFTFLSEYLERNYALSSKTKNALVYPAFIVVVFVVIMILMLIKVIPQLAEIIEDAGQEVPLYTKVVIGLSDFFVHYGVFLLVLIVVAAFFVWRSLGTRSGRERLDNLKINLPGFGKLYRKIYLARISDNINTMLTSGIPVIRTLEVAGDVVGNVIFQKIMQDTVEEVKGGNSISNAFEKHEEIPQIMVQMVKVGEESGSIGKILETLAKFYNKEVSDTVDTLIGLIEPAMIILLGIGVGGLLMSVMIPIYNIAGSIG